MHPRDIAIKHLVSFICFWELSIDSEHIFMHFYALITEAGSLVEPGNPPKFAEGDLVLCIRLHQNTLHCQ